MRRGVARFVVAAAVVCGAERAQRARSAAAAARVGAALLIMSKALDAVHGAGGGGREWRQTTKSVGVETNQPTSAAFPRASSPTNVTLRRRAIRMNSVDWVSHVDASGVAGTVELQPFSRLLPHCSRISPAHEAAVHAALAAEQGQRESVRSNAY